MHASLFSTLALCLTFFNLALASDSSAQGAVLTPRQAANPNACLDYRTTAMHAIIGANTSYRSAYLSQSNVGTLYDFRMFDAAIAKLPSLTADRALNDRCRNQTEIVAAEAASNFTRGSVGPFENVPKVTITNGPIVAVLVTCCFTIFGLTWIFMP